MNSLPQLSTVPLFSHQTQSSPPRQNAVASRPRRLRPVGDRASIDAVRIAVGKKVFSRQCELSFQFGTRDPYLRFAYLDKDRPMAHDVSLSLKKEELTEVKYFIAGDEDEATDDDVEPMTVIAFRITPNARNKFDKYSNAYRQENDDNEERYERRYVSVEVRDPDEFQVRLAQIDLCICVRASDWERGLVAFPLEQQQSFERTMSACVRGLHAL